MVNEHLSAQVWASLVPGGPLGEVLAVILGRRAELAEAGVDTAASGDTAVASTGAPDCSGLDGSTGCIPWGPPVPPRFRGASVVA
jgi:hypothetical protein